MLETIQYSIFPSKSLVKKSDKSITLQWDSVSDSFVSHKSFTVTWLTHGRNGMDTRPPLDNKKCKHLISVD